MHFADRCAGTHRVHSEAPQAPFSAAGRIWGHDLGDAKWWSRWLGWWELMDHQHQRSSLLVTIELLTPAGCETEDGDQRRWMCEMQSSASCDDFLWPPVFFENLLSCRVGVVAARLFRTPTLGLAGPQAVPDWQIGPFVSLMAKLPRLGAFGAGGFYIPVLMNPIMRAPMATWERFWL